jgi:hypothetical protein
MWASLLILAAALPSAPGEAPSWSKDELRTLFARCEAAGRLPTIEAQDAELATVVGAAYRLSREGGEDNETYARRVTKKRVPTHPAVGPGQWLLAATKLFYEDAAQRSEAIARFERDRRDRLYFEEKAKQAQAAVAALGPMVQTRMKGVDGFMAPLPAAKADKPGTFGCAAFVRGQTISVENLDRITFVNDRPAPDAPRTRTGAIRELMASQKQYNLTAATMGQIDAAYRKGQGLLRVFIPATAPAVYLNELILGAIEAKMKTVYVMTYDPKSDELQELPISLEKPRASKKKRSVEPAYFRCKDTVLMQSCVDYAIEMRAKGPLHYRTE